MSAAPYRLLATGSRNWRDRPVIRAALHAVLSGPEPQAAGAVVLVHGGQVSTDPVTGERYGADYLVGEEFPAVAAALGLGHTVEVHRADWKRYGNGAGPRRNKLMVARGANHCLGFPIGESRGTFDCLRRVEKAGIPITVVPATADTLRAEVS